MKSPKSIVRNLAFRAIKWASKPFRDPLIASWFGGDDDDTGIVVNANTAMQVAAVSAAIRLLSETIASLPIILYKPVKDGKERAVNHPLYDLLHRKPNRFQTPYEFKSMISSHVLSRGAGYGEIISTGGSGVSEVIPRHPDRVIPFWAPDGKRAYKYQPLDGPSRIILQEEMFHIMFFSDDGLNGMDPITNHRRTIGLTIGAEKYGARFYKNDAKPGFALEHPGKLSDIARQNLKDSWMVRHQGVDNSHRPAILEEGMQLKELSMTGRNAQYIETRKFQVAEIARIFRVPPHMIGDLEKATFSNIEMQSLEFVIYCLTPWLVKWEQAITRDLLSDTDSKTLFAEFKVDALLRGDTKSRFTAYKDGRQWGWLNVDEIRAMENMNPLPDGKGNVYLSPLNMTPVENLRNQTPEEVRAMQLVMARTLFKNLPNDEATKIIKDIGES